MEYTIIMATKTDHLLCRSVDQNSTAQLRLILTALRIMQSYQMYGIYNRGKYKFHALKDCAPGTLLPASACANTFSESLPMAVAMSDAILHMIKRQLPEACFCQHRIVKKEMRRFCRARD